MNALVFNTAHVKYQETDKGAVLIFDCAQDDQTFFEGTSIYILDPNGYGKALLIGKSNINGVTENRISSNLNAKKKDMIIEYKISLEKVEPFKSYNTLEAYSYSLGKIYRYQNPIVQFRRSFTILPQNDDYTLQNEWIYVSRTVFGRLLNSLPRINKLDFISNVINLNDTNDLSEVSYLNGLYLLKEYIDDKILQNGKYLVATKNNIQSKLKNLLSEARDIGFVLENDKTESIINQANLFERVFELEQVFINVRSELEKAQRNYSDASVYLIEDEKRRLRLLDKNIIFTKIVNLICKSL